MCNSLEAALTVFVLDDFLPYQLSVAAQRVSRDFSRLYREEFGISIPEWRVLAHLSRSGRVSVREIHRRVDMDKSKVSRAASRLESAGFVTKQTNPSDRRLVELELTADGRSLIEKIAPIARRYEATVMKRLGPCAPQFREALAALTHGGQPGTG